MPYSERHAASIQNFARNAVADWSALCQQCLDYQPDAEKVQEHVTMLKWLIRFARVMHMTTSDPDYPDRPLADELDGRLIQLEHALRQFNNPLPTEEADRLEASLFT